MPVQRVRLRRIEGMTQEQITLLAIKAAISELPPEHEERCNELAEHIRRMIKEAGSPVGDLALALVGQERIAGGD
jgi:hypothetical protein